jgi:hypothetical protein
MRVAAVVGLVAVVVGVAAAFVLPYRGSAAASPLTVTLVAAAACLWIGFSANRDAAGRLKKIRRAFAVHGEEGRLLRDHWLVYVMILVGPKTGVWLLILGGLMIALTWPTARKTQLLLGRARALRENS